jgi:hypothetical protein
VTLKEISDLARDVKAGLANQQARQVKTVPKPAILDQEPPKELSLTWIEEHKKAEASYVEGLLGKGTPLTQSETAFLAGRISRFLKSE